MQFFKNILRKIIKDDKKILGRWTIESCNTKINNKIDLSNEDHCGPCGQYILDKTNSPTQVVPPCFGNSTNTYAPTSLRRSRKLDVDVDINKTRK